MSCQSKQKVVSMPKQKKKVSEDTQVLLFAVKVVGSAVLAAMVALGMDTYHAVESIGKLYGGTV